MPGCRGGKIKVLSEGVPAGERLIVAEATIEAAFRAGVWPRLTFAP